MRFNTFNNMKISKKISLVHSLIFLALQIVICSILLLTIRIYYPIEASGEIRSLVSEISQNIGSYDKSLKSASKEDIIPFIPSKFTVFTRITDLNGNTLLKYGKLDYYLNIGPPYNRITRINAKDTHLIYCNSLIKTNGKENVVLQVVVDIAQNLEFNTTLFKVLLILTALGFIISIFTGYIVSRVVLKPISNIIKTAQSINADSLNVRIETNNAKDELYELSSTINDMIARLQGSFEKQEQLISDVSHELKTPISVMKGYVSLLDRWGKDNPDVLQESISRIGREAENMAGIVEDLLFLARKDNGTLCLDEIEFNMNELIDEIIDDTRTISSGGDISIQRNDSCRYFGDYRLIKQMLRILIDNSIKYSDKMFMVRIWSENKGSYLNIVIEDSGIGIASGDLEKIFDRFYRADKARTRNKGGTGLGLSITKAIVDSHNGKIRAESEIGKGTKITIEMPFIKS